MGAGQLSLGIRNRAQGRGDPTVKLLGPEEAAVRAPRRRVGTVHPGHERRQERLRGTDRVGRGLLGNVVPTEDSQVPLHPSTPVRPVPLGPNR